MTIERVTIFGLGLIGGSLALSLRRRLPGVVVTGIDRASVLEKPAAARAAQELVVADDREGVIRTLSACDLAVLALPVRVIQAELPFVLDHADVVTDCGSTKRAICARVAEHPRRGRFVAAHPMAGAPEGGIEQACDDLFEGKRWLVCPDGSDRDAVERVERSISTVGAHTISLSASDHDRAVARTSHLTQLLASALLMVGHAANAEFVAGPSFASATRVAGGPEAMWQDIFATNADEIAAALAELVSELAPVQRELAQAPAVLDAARDLLTRARLELGR
jgi:prephenate dehydrogenase